MTWPLYRARGRAHPPLRVLKIRKWSHRKINPQGHCGDRLGSRAHGLGGARSECPRRGLGRIALLFFMDIFLLAFASELRTTKGQLWASIWFKNGSAAWNEPPGANQLTPLPPLVSLSPQPPQEVLLVCRACVVAIQSFFCHSRPCSSRSDLARQDTETEVIFEVPQPPGPLRPAMYSPCDRGCCNCAPEGLLAAWRYQTRVFLVSLS
jgi:hypothetical protein